MIIDAIRKLFIPKSSLQEIVQFDTVEGPSSNHKMFKRPFRLGNIHTHIVLYIKISVLKYVTIFNMLYTSSIEKRSKMGIY